MEQRTSTINPKPRVTPVKAHRRQALVQIWLPLILAILIMLALMALTVYGAVIRSPDVDKWGAISAIYVILPVLFTGLLVLGLLGGMVYLLAKLLNKLPDWATVLHMYVIHAALLVRRGLDAVTKPVFAASDFAASAEALWKHYFH